MVFLKDLKTFASVVGLESIDDVLLIDDTPTKCLPNDPYNAIHLQTWSGAKGDTYLNDHLLPWLDSLFKSNEVVPVYVKNHLLIDSQDYIDPLSSEAFSIL